MGAHPYWYFVPYDSDAGNALAELRQRELRAGRYNPVTPFPKFPVDPFDTSSAARHKTTEQALRDAGDDGTRSILDIFRGIADEPNFCQAAPLSVEQVTTCFGTPRPTRQNVESNLRALGFIERAHYVYVTVYDNDTPSEILFFGYSFD